MSKLVELGRVTTETKAYDTTPDNTDAIDPVLCGPFVPTAFPY